MKRLVHFVILACAALAITLAAQCAKASAIQLAQQSHDYLALAGDSEAQLCWGVASVPAAIAAGVTPNHCTSAVAATVGLTDARHQQFNALMATALKAQAAYATQLQAGGQADVTPLQNAIDALIAVVAQLVPPSQPAVAATTLHLQQARIK